MIGWVMGVILHRRRLRRKVKVVVTVFLPGAINWTVGEIGPAEEVRVTYQVRTRA